MPSKYIVRNFTEGGTYHIYNRVRDTDSPLFRDENDYKTFLFYIYVYAKPLKQVLKTYPALPFRLQIKNMSQDLDIFAYVLFEDHFHLLVRQHSKDAIPRFMKQLNNAYTEYYNKKYSHSGTLMHGRYRAAHLDNSSQLLPMTRFIHLHPYLSNPDIEAASYPWSSMREYMDESIDSFCTMRPILSYYSSAQHYAKFVTDESAHIQSLALLKPLFIEKSILRG